MDYGLIIGIIGTIATLIFGFVGIIIPFRKNNQKTIEFVEEENINLYNSVVKNISDLSLRFKSTPINENVHLLRGFLINVGNQDITTEMIEKKLKILLNKNSKWLSAKIINKSTNLSANLEFDKNELEFQTGLFRHNEFIYFEAIAESSSNKLKNEIEIDHRIANTKNIAYKSLDNFTFFKTSINSILPFLLALFIMYLFEPNKLSSYDIDSISETKVESQIVIDSLFFHEYEIYNDSMGLYSQALLKALRNQKINIISSNEYKLRDEVVKEYSYLRLLIEGKTKFYNYGDGGKIQFRVSSWSNFIIIAFSFLVTLILVVTLTNDFLTYRKLSPTFEVIKNEILKREKNTAANNT